MSGSKQNKKSSRRFYARTRAVHEFGLADTDRFMLLCVDENLKKESDSHDEKYLTKDYAQSC